MWLDYSWEERKKYGWNQMSSSGPGTNKEKLVFFRTTLDIWMNSCRLHQEFGWGVQAYRGSFRDYPGHNAGKTCEYFKTEPDTWCRKLRRAGSICGSRHSKDKYMPLKFAKKKNRCIKDRPFWSNHWFISGNCVAGNWEIREVWGDQTGRAGRRPQTRVTVKY